MKEEVSTVSDVQRGQADARLGRDSHGLSVRGEEQLRHHGSRCHSVQTELHGPGWTRADLHTSLVTASR